MRGEATILHADLDSFFASVEQRDDPSLRGRPVIVGRGVVLAASYEAKARGVRTAMGARQARRLCPEAVVVPARMEAYARASKDVFAVFRDTTPLVEALSIDEAFLEVGGLRRTAGTPEEIAARLRRRVASEVGLPITVGVARTKSLAKVASAVAKPDGLLVVPPESEREFLHPLPVRALWGVGGVTGARLEELGIHTVGQLAQLEEATLGHLVGRAAGRHLHALAALRDPRPVVPTRRRGSVGSQRALGRWSGGPAELDEVVVGLVDRVTTRLRRDNRIGRTVVLRLRFEDYGRATRSRTLRHPTGETATILGVLRELVDTVRRVIDERGLTLVGVAVADLYDDSAVQLSLPLDRGPAIALDSAVDLVRERFGAEAIGRARMLGKRVREGPPLIEDSVEAS